jgi:hypothetical protein
MGDDFMFRLAPRAAAVLLATLFAGPLAGCTALTAMADSQQKPPITTYAVKASQEKTFTAAVQAMGGFGKLLSQDKASGVVQGQKGNWIMNATVGEAVDSTRLQLSARYVPSQQMDFFTRDGLTLEYIALIEASLGEKVMPSN